MSPPRLVLAMSIGLLVSPAAGESLHVRVPERAGTAVERALRASRQRLDDPVCQEVFSDFTAQADRRPVREVLQSRGVSAADHLASLDFQDGSAQATCSRPGILAFTHVGARTVFVCPEAFVRAVERDPGFAEIVLIHELLHTLGVAENPPTSREITARVQMRCGDWRGRSRGPRQGRGAGGV